MYKLFLFRNLTFSILVFLQIIDFVKVLKYLFIANM